MFDQSCSWCCFVFALLVNVYSYSFYARVDHTKKWEPFFSCFGKRERQRKHTAICIFVHSEFFSLDALNSDRGLCSVVKNQFSRFLIFASLVLRFLRFAQFAFHNIHTSFFVRCVSISLFPSPQHPLSRSLALALLQFSDLTNRTHVLAFVFMDKRLNCWKNFKKRTLYTWLFIPFWLFIIILLTTLLWNAYKLLILQQRRKTVFSVGKFVLRSI